MEDGEYKELFKNYNEILNETVKHISKFENAKVIDIGSGTGNLTNIASKIGYDIVGIEPNLKTRNIATAKYPEIKIFIRNIFITTNR